MAWKDGLHAGALLEHGGRRHWPDGETSTLELVDDAGATVAVFFAGRMVDGFHPVRLGKGTRGAIALVMVDLELLNRSSGRFGDGVETG